MTVVARDLGRPDAGRTLRAELESRGIHAAGLVNNAGFGTRNALTDEDPDRLQSMIALNVSARVDLSRAYIDPLNSAGTGILINVASVLGFQPTPYLSVYGATKAFVLSFTESLWEENGGTGLRALAVCPGATKTEFYDAAGGETADYEAKRVTPEHVVRTALETLDRRSAPPSVITNGRSIALAGKILPRRLIVRFMGRMARPNGRPPLSATRSTSQAALIARRSAIEEAITTDFGNRSRPETAMMELGGVGQGIRSTRSIPQSAKKAAARRRKAARMTPFSSGWISLWARRMWSSTAEWMQSKPMPLRVARSAGRPRTL